MALSRVYLESRQQRLGKAVERAPCVVGCSPCCGTPCVAGRLCCGVNPLCYGAPMPWGACASQAGEVSLPSSLRLLFIPRESCVLGELTESQPCMKQVNSTIVWDTVCTQNDQAGEEEILGEGDGACVQRALVSQHPNLSSAGVL